MLWDIFQNEGAFLMRKKL